MSAPASLPYPVGSQVPNPDLVPLIRRAAGDLPVDFRATKTDIDCVVQPADLLRLVTALREGEDLAFDFLRNIAGIDFGEEGMALKYAFYSFRHGHALQVTVPLPPAQDPHPRVPTLSALYATANWHEREASEMFGIEFEGHPNPKNLLLEEDVHIQPLLKAHPLQAAEILQGIEAGPPGYRF